MNRRAVYSIGLLLIVGFLTHLIFLSYPRHVIFDEVHFGKFVTAYCCTHERFFDIHPPHAKLLIAGTAYLFGYRGGFDFDHIGESYGTIPVAAVRSFPAVMGIILPLIMYTVLRQLGVAQPLAGIGGLLVALDNALLVQTRLIALDGTLLVATFGSLSAFLAATKKQGQPFILYSLLSGALAGLAVGTKFTGLSSVFLLGLLVLYGVLTNFTISSVARRLGQVFWLAVAFLIVYLSGWAAHFLLLTKPGSGDAWNIPHFEQPIIVSFFRETIKLHKTMLDANYHLTATHPYSSPWWQWLIMQKPIFYWQGPGTAVIYFIGNPVVWWGSTLLLIGALLAAIRHFKQIFQDYRWVPWAGFLIAIGPMVRIPRALFLYHYLTPLLFALLIGLMWLDSFPAAARRKSQILLMGAVIVAFMVVMPFTYGLTVPSGWSWLLRLLV